MIDNDMISITEANQNFSNVAKKCRQHGKLYILKNNKIEFLLKSYDEENREMEISDDEIIDIASRRVLKKYHKAFEELAKWLR